MLEHHHVGLVAADRREHVVGLHQRGEPLGLPERRHRFVVASELRERDARQRVDEREMTAIAGGEQRRRGLGDVLADDRDVADLAVALAELVVGEADGARVVRDLGVLQRAAVQRDGARLIAARRGEPAVQPPERREPRRGNRVAEGVRRPAERGRRLIEIVLQQPRFGERRADGELVFARQARGAKGGREQLRGFGTAAALERGACAREKRLQGGGRHRGSIQVYRPRGAKWRSRCVRALVTAIAQFFQETIRRGRRGALRAAPSSRSRRTPRAPRR